MSEIKQHERLGESHQLSSHESQLTCSGGYNVLPSVIEDLRKEPPLPPRKRAAAIQLMDQLLREQLLQVVDPFL